MFYAAPTLPLEDGSMADDDVDQYCVSKAVMGVTTRIQTVSAQGHRGRPLFIAWRLMAGTPSAAHSAIALSDASRLPLGAEECRGGDCLHVAAASASLRLTAANSSLIYYSTHHTVAGRPLPCYVEPQLALTSPRASTKYALQLEMRRLPRSTCSGNFALTAISGPSFFFE